MKCIFAIAGVVAALIGGMILTDVMFDGFDRETCARAHKLLGEHEAGLYTADFYISADERAACERMGNPIKGV